EFFVYLCFPLIAVVVARRFWGGLLAVVAALAVAIVISQALLDTRMTILNWQLGALRAVPSFALGVWLYSHRERLAAVARSPSRALLGFTVSSLILIVLLAVDASDYAILA